MEKKKAYLTSGTGITGYQHVEKMQTDPYLSPCTKLKSKWIKDHNIKPATLNLTEEKGEAHLNALAQETTS